MLQLDAQDDVEDLRARTCTSGRSCTRPPSGCARRTSSPRRPGCASRCSSPRTASTATRSGTARRSSRPSSAWPRRWDADLRRARGAGDRGRGRRDRHPLDLLPRALHRPRPALGPRRARRSARTRSSSASSRRRWCAATRATGSTTRPRSWPPPSTSPATPRRRAAATPPRPTSRRRKLRSWFLPPFERVAREGCRTFMLGYQSIDGVPITVNDWLLNDVLRGEWGYTGTLVTDWDNVGRMVWEQQVQPDYAHAAAAAVRAGNDMVMTTPGFFEGAQEAVARRGCSTRPTSTPPSPASSRSSSSSGLFEDPRAPDPSSARPRSSARAEHAELNLEVARRSLVLLTQRRHPARSSAGRTPTTHRRRRPQRRRRAHPARRLGRRLRPGRLAARRPPARDDHRPCSTASATHAPAGWTVTHARGAEILTLGADPEGEFFPDGQPRPPVVFPARPTRP